MRNGCVRGSAILAFLVAVILVCAAVEAGGRLYLYRVTKSKVRSKPSGFTATSGPLYQSDGNRGYSCVPNSDLQFRFHDANSHVVWKTRAHINNLGHVSPRNDIIEMKDSEFRIVCLGNSFTAIVQNENPWTAVLEESLNQDTEL